MNPVENKSLSAETEQMNRVFAELRAAKFNFPRGWNVDRNIAVTEQPSRRYDSEPHVSAQPSRTNVQDAVDIAAGADRPTHSLYRSDAEIMGLDLFGEPAAAPVYRQIRLPNYAGPAFRSAMAIVDAAFNRPLLLSVDNVVVNPSAVLKTPPSTPKVLRRLADCQVLAGRDGDVARRRWSSARNITLPLELETENGTRRADHSPEVKGNRLTLWSRTKRFIHRMFCCGV
ncbi:unnamed protein product [Macrosiphum euphorbiae]|uniref:Uncharacterized protein n=1 Tax=Macrosiphum euphorbiae TaxID=13131 RepID=A0AAV0W6I2_9HEMI|nr:unnamed protein product [Macrosiphum euphorbiae]